MKVFRRKGLTAAIVGGIIIGFLIPLVAGWVLYVSRAEKVAHRDLRVRHERMLDVLVRNLREPLLNFSPEGASSAVRLLMQDEDIASVRVHSSIYEMDIANFSRHEVQYGDLLVARRHILFNGEVLGFVDVSTSSAVMEKRLGTRRVRLLWLFLSMLGCGLAIVIPLVWFKALVPLRRLVEYADEIASGNLDKPLNWSGGSIEFARLAHAMESMRKSLAKSFQEVEELAALDELTGIANRRKFRELAEREVRLAKRYGSELSLILFDVDDFKKINDSYGHAEGDRVLQDIVACVNSEIRGVDIFSRWGGEEFVLLFPETSRDGAFYVAEKLRSIMAHEVHHKGGIVTCSFGVSTYTATDDLYSLLERADAALYRAKQEGKDRVKSA